MKKRDKVILIAVALIVIVAALYSNKENTSSATSETFCETDSDCIQDSCCHATSCVNKDSKADCSDIFCTADCQPDTLDCGQGSCLCQNNKCLAVIG